ncbi:MAG: hypothetical protein JST92_13710 [Deltaproteobacteria bacterium]|nr:hypothetical protein [Deltaproteobacteria bacterium]
MPLRFVRAQLDEIARDPALRLYGVAVAGLHALTWLWLMTIGAARVFAPNEVHLCWPLVPCDELPLTPPLAHAVFGAYLACALASATLFLRRRIGAAWLLLCITTLLDLAIVLLDFRFRLNQHYMALFITLTFLFVPQRRRALPLLITLFYFWAGALKLNWDWLSGNDLYVKPWLFSGRGLVAACAYVIVLELVFTWGLLARSPRVFWAALAQFALFHVFSFHIVGWFYPVLMFFILSIHPLCRFLAMPEESRAPLGAPVIALAVFFSLLQLVPHFLPGDRALTGEGRLFALHMFDARLSCEAHVEVLTDSGQRLSKPVRPLLAQRITCDPLVYLSYANKACKTRGVRDLDLFLQSRHDDAQPFTKVLALHGVCSHPPSYNPLWHNPWILTGEIQDSGAPVR